jgi:aminoglycoside 3-N-acetyltransferase
VDTWLGATSAYVVARPDRVRCRRSAGEFTALGPDAAEWMGYETPDDVYGPLRGLVDRDGRVVLMGVSLTSMTLLHLAESVAGRGAFVRWALGPDGSPARSRGGECSKGFDNLADALAPIEQQTRVGKSVWRAYPARETLRLASDAIRANPSITHCADHACIECADAVAGGPLV